MQQLLLLKASCSKPEVGMWVSKRFRCALQNWAGKEERVQAEPADLSTQTRAASVDLKGLPESGAVVGWDGENRVNTIQVGD